MRGIVVPGTSAAPRIGRWTPGAAAVRRCANQRAAGGAALLQILVNLVDNAIRHGRTGGETVVSAVAADNAVRFLVDDDGPGIPKRDRQRIWRRFVRLDGRTRATGSGIGLSVVAELVAAMDGHTFVTDSPLGGARFVVEIPFGVAEAPTQRQAVAGPMLAQR